MLDLYAEAYDPQYPTVCLDEKPVVLHAQTRPAQAATPGAQGHVERRDYEYVRQGTADLFVMVEPLAGWRHGAVTERRTRAEFAEQLRYLVEDRYPTGGYVWVRVGTCGYVWVRVGTCGYVWVRAAGGR